MLLNFLTVFLLTFALFMLIAGLFTAYFGGGKSRVIGIVLLVIGLVVGFGFGYYAGYMNKDIYLMETIKSALLILIAAIVGALAAIGVFLAAIMKA